MHSLIDESTTVKALDHHVHLSAKARADGTHFCSHGIESQQSSPYSEPVNRCQQAARDVSNEPAVLTGTGSVAVDNVWHYSHRYPRTPQHTKLEH